LAHNQFNIFLRLVKIKPAVKIALYPLTGPTDWGQHESSPILCPSDLEWCVGQPLDLLGWAHGCGTGHLSDLQVRLPAGGGGFGRGR